MQPVMERRDIRRKAVLVPRSCWRAAGSVAVWVVRVGGVLEGWSW